MTTLDTFTTSHIIDQEFNEYEFPSSVVFQYDSFETNAFVPTQEEESDSYSSDDELIANIEIDNKALNPCDESDGTINKSNDHQLLDLTHSLSTFSSSSNPEDINGEYADESFNEELEQFVEEEDNEIENPIDPIILTYCSKKYCVFTDFELNPDNIKGNQSTEQVIFSDKHELYSTSLKSFMQSLQSHFKIINDIVIFFPTLKLKFTSHISFAEKLSLRDVAFLASNVNSESHIFQIELTEEPYNFINQYQQLINKTDEELSEDETLPVDETNSPLGKRQRETNNDNEEQEAKRQKL